MLHWRPIKFFLNEILQISKFKFFVSWEKFSRIAHTFLKFEDVKHTWQVLKLKNYFENSWKIVPVFGRRTWILGMPLGTWACKNNWITDTHLARCYVEPFIGTLPCKKEKLVGTLLVGSHVGTQTTLAHMAHDLANSI